MEESPKFHSPPRCPLPALHAPKGENEDLLPFVVLKAHWTATLNGCQSRCGTSRLMTIHYPYYKNVSGGQEWPNK